MIVSPKLLSWLVMGASVIAYPAVATAFQPTPNQQLLVDALRDRAVTVVVATGMAGTGKTMLACTHGASLVQKKQFKQLVLTRSVRSTSGKEEIGHLPGSLQEKMAPWVAPMMEYIKNAEEACPLSKVHIVPLQFMRGYTFRDSFIIVDECQNIPVDIFRMLLTRLGERSKLVLVGDPSQCDLSAREHSGLAHFIARLPRETMPEVQWIRFTPEDCRRHALIPRLLACYDSA